MDDNTNRGNDHEDEHSSPSAEETGELFRDTPFEEIEKGTKSLNDERTSKTNI